MPDDTLSQDTSGKDSGGIAATDHPLKRLVSLLIDDFAAWLLNSPVRGTQRHEIQGPAAVAPLVWHYQVVRLWQMSAEDLLALDQPALLALVGQTRLKRPAVVLPAVVARLRQVPDAEVRAV